jgi:hypothetical protein
MIEKRSVLVLDVKANREDGKKEDEFEAQLKYYKEVSEEDGKNDD